jgi:uncharacterized protein YdeI (YjbR/CyaY-like superfamily)
MKTVSRGAARSGFRSFASPRDWARWLAKHHAKSDGVWLRFFKKTADRKALTYAEALDEALCYGWIDGQAKKHDDASWLQKFTPRRSKSIWSKRNRDHVARLVALKKMRSAGLREVEAARADGRWEQAYDSPRNLSVPKDFLQALGKSKKGAAFFATLNRANVYAITWRLQTAKKAETRDRRMAAILAMLEKGEKFH